MNLEALSRSVEAIKAAGPLDREAIGVAHDSRECAPGSVFAAIEGERFDGHKFIPQALEKGCIAVISERAKPVEFAAAWIQVGNARSALAAAAAVIYGDPSNRLKLVGITGTNGKTTTEYLVDSIIRAAEGTSAMIGTICQRIGDAVMDSYHTTPEASDIQRILATAVEQGCRSAVMEVSSHAIELHRADGLHFAAAIFTNLTRDHLDYHHDMESYFAAKRKLFDGSLGSSPRACAINIDDQYGKRLLQSAEGEIITYGFSSEADVKTSNFSCDARGVRFVAETPSGEIDIDSPLVGRPHVYNILAATAAGLALGFDLKAIADGVRDCKSVPGRFEQVYLNEDQTFTVVVDYAHTDDALKNVLGAAREVAGPSSKVITVFGCGGDRDRTKRSPMGEAAALLSDAIIVTSDNPRSEDPEAILEDVEKGIQKITTDYRRIADRREAIFEATNIAGPGDIVVIAGKGHETYQIQGARTIHFDDREVALEALSERFTAGT